MDVLDLVDRARPDVPPIPHAARRHIRERLFDTGARPEQVPVLQPEPVPPRVRRRARQVIGGFVVLLAVVALVSALLRFIDPGDDEASPASTTVPSAAVTTAPAPATTVARAARQLPVRFTPLLPVAPADHELLWARFDGPNRRRSVGVARYVAPGTPVELQVRIRPQANAFAGSPPEDGPTWRVRRRTVRPGGDGTCSGSECSVEVQWNDRTAVTLAWTDPTGGALPAWATHESLVEVVGSLRSRPAAWEPGPVDPDGPAWDTPSARHAPLLVPTDAERIIDTRQRPGWPGTESAILLASDDTVIGVQEGDGPPLPLDLAEAREIGDVTVAAPEPDAPAPVYGLEITCGFARVHDQNGSEPNRPEISTLLRRTTIDRGRIELDVPPGWTVLDAGPGDDVFEIQFTVDVLGDETILTLLQSPGGSVAALMYGGRSFAPGDIGGEPAWVHRAAEGAGVAVVSTRGDTAWELGGEGVSVDDLVAALGALAPETTAGWVERFGPLETVELDTTSCPQQPELVIDAP